MATEVLLKVDLGLWMVTSPNEGETQRDKKKKKNTGLGGFGSWNP